MLEEFKDIYGDIYVDERVSEDPPAGVQRIYAAMWDCMRGGGERQREREGEGEGRGGEGRGETTLCQNHSTSTSKPLDKHSTPINRHYKARSYDRSVHPKSLSE